MAIATEHSVDDLEASGEPIFADINITPLTDVFLVMVVIFMVSALAVQAERNTEKQRQEPKPSGVALKLPPSTSHDVDVKRAMLVLEIPLAGDVYIAGKRLDDAELDAMFRTAIAANKDTQVILRADRGVSHGRVVQIMDRARRAGFAQLAIGTGAE